jgi:hypothetical protein
MLSISLGNGSAALGLCCVSVGDGAVTRGAFQVKMTETLSFPSEITEKNITDTVSALQDLCLTYQAMVDQNHAPADFGVRSKAAIDVAVDSLNRHKARLAAASTPTPVETTTATPVVTSVDTPTVTSVQATSVQATSVQATPVQATAQVD